MLGPDAKSQVTVAYRDGKPVKATSIVVSTQHLDETMTSEDVREVVEPYRAPGAAARTGSTARPSGTSTRPASSSSAARTATAA